ncbi:MAG: helix-turn-helix domain-containing protein [Bacteroidales bacterium]|nr:helix-turn-helix domain-containing protein [Bacteroidales bacterium]
MKALKYTLIKSEEQYYEYVRILKKLVIQENEEKEDEIELIELLIDKWDQDRNTMNEVDPVELLKFLMEDHNLKAKDLTEILGLSKGTVSKILNYQKGFSKATIRKLSRHFKLVQEAFNRPYPLVGQVPKDLRPAS